MRRLHPSPLRHDEAVARPQARALGVGVCRRVEVAAEVAGVEEVVGFAEVAAEGADGVLDEVRGAGPLGGLVAGVEEVEGVGEFA
jgi:hypothetical protein